MIMKKRGIRSKPLIAAIGMIEEDQIIPRGTMDNHKWKSSHHSKQHMSTS